MLLERRYYNLHGGIWLDADIIIISSKIKYFFESPSNKTYRCSWCKKDLLFVVIGLRMTKKNIEL